MNSALDLQRANFLQKVFSSTEMVEQTLLTTILSNVLKLNHQKILQKAQISKPKLGE